jgi:cytochrome c
VLGHDGDNDGWIFRTLALVDCGGIGRNQHVEFAKSVGDGSAVEMSDKFSRIRIDIVDVADVTVINVLVVVILDLHYLVAGREGPAEALNLAITGGVQRSLQCDVERAGADAASGQLLFNNACRTCHTTKEGDNRLGPNLHNIIGRKAGSLPNFGYSSAMKGADFVWDKEKLDRFIAKPDEVVPGNSMKPYGGLTSAEDRAKVIVFLESPTTN